MRCKTICISCFRNWNPTTILLLNFYNCILSYWSFRFTSNRSSCCLRTQDCRSIRCCWRLAWVVLNRYFLLNCNISCWKKAVVCVISCFQFSRTKGYACIVRSSCFRKCLITNSKSNFSPSYNIINLDRLIWQTTFFRDCIFYNNWCFWFNFNIDADITTMDSRTWISRQGHSNLTLINIWPWCHGIIWCPTIYPFKTSIIWNFCFAIRWLQSILRCWNNCT